VRQGRRNPSVPAALFAGSEFHRRVLRRAGKPSPKETGKSETIRAAAHAFSVVGQLGRAGHRIHKPKNNLDNLHQPELSQPTMVKQLRSRGSLPRIPLQGTSQEVEELRVRGAFFDAVLKPNSVDSSVHPFSFKMISMSVRYRLGWYSPFSSKKAPDRLQSSRKLFGGTPIYLTMDSIDPRSSVLPKRCSANISSQI
jgi:hypothetical protein